MSTSVLVTGATGWLGGHTLRALRAEHGVHLIAAVRDPSRLPPGLADEVRVGDLTDPAYRRDLVEGVDVLLHAGTWGSFWGHAQAERELFAVPALDLIERAVDAGVSRVLLASTVAISTPPPPGERVPDGATGVRRGYWPHLDRLVDVEDRMRALAGAGPARTTMVPLRLGHFVGPGLALGLVPALIPRLRTRLVPWVDRGRARMPLVTGDDAARAIARAALATGLPVWAPTNVVGAEQPTAREVFSFIAREAGVPTPSYSVPVGAAFAFAAATEAVHRVTPGRAPFLTRPLVHVGQDWHADTARARETLGFTGIDDWRDAVRASVAQQRAAGYPWPALAQGIAAV